MRALYILCPAALALALVPWGEGAGTPTPPTSATPPVTATAVAPPVRVAESPTPAPDPARRDLLELPDGSFVPCLNGATNAAPLRKGWDPRLPYSPIVRVERDAGIDWYVHADGTKSTTVMVYRSDLGRDDALTRVAHVAPTPPQARR